MRIGGLAAIERGAFVPRISRAGRVRILCFATECSGLNQAKVNAGRLPKDCVTHAYAGKGHARSA